MGTGLSQGILFAPSRWARPKVMPQPLRNPFYVLLVLNSFALLLTMFIYLMGWFYLPGPGLTNPAAPMPPWMKWIDRHAMYLIAGGVLTGVLLAFCTITLDRYFERRDFARLQRSHAESSVTTGAKNEIADPASPASSTVSGPGAVEHPPPPPPAATET